MLYAFKKQLKKKTSKLLKSYSIGSQEKKWVRVDDVIGKSHRDDIWMIAYIWDYGGKKHTYYVMIAKIQK